MLDLLRKTSKVFSSFLHPMNIGCSIISFLLRYILVGRSNAFTYLSRVGKESIIPILRIMGASVGKNCDVETGIIFHNCYDLRNLSLGNNVHIGKNCLFDIRNEVRIGNNVVISMCCSFITHIEMSQSNLASTYVSNNEKIIIGNHTYMGIGTVVLKGVTIGDSVLVGAKSLVNRSFTQKSVIMGAPAKLTSKTIDK
jgi:acetyltransferase-like isoleucine patch superfamily enzyme